MFRNLYLVSLAVVLTYHEASIAFAPHTNFELGFLKSKQMSSKTRLYGDGNPPPFPDSSPPPSDQSASPTDLSPGKNDAEGLWVNRANRFSQFAPSTELPTEDFRAQLKENMKADLEKRRQKNPNRGNQPARSYLDSL